MLFMLVDGDGIARAAPIIGEDLVGHESPDLGMP
jgi:hypothetical protein